MRKRRRRRRKVQREKTRSARVRSGPSERGRFWTGESRRRLTGEDTRGDREERERKGPE